jgi:hypothetical protein
MTAAQALEGARRAGLRIFPIGEELRIRGRAPIVEVWRPIIEPLSDQICALLEPTSGLLERDDRRCAGCGRDGFTVLVSTDDGALMCRACMAPAGNR